MQSNENVSEISKFYSGKTIFVTGATGFMGKVLIEKLLRDCSELSKIYILVRAKKEVDPEQRRVEYVNHMVFNRVREETPSQMDKICVIKGDVSMDRLGISEKDEHELIANVNLIFNCAANVRFDLSLKDALNSNTNGTHRLLKLAEKMKNLVVFSHVSTAYSQCKEDVVEERYYQPSKNSLGIIEMVKLVDDKTLEMITNDLLNGLPNTYSLSKGLSEDLVHSYASKFSIVISRPSIVTASWKDPYPGWIEGMNGPTGLMIGAGKGVIRSMHCNPDMASEAVPVDMTINAIIALAYKRSKLKSNDCYFCNITDSGCNPITWGQSLGYGRELFYEFPMCQSLWYPRGSLKSNYYHHILCVFFFHYLPAYFIDTLMVIFRQKPFLVKVQKRVSQGLKVLQYFTTRDWEFKNDNFLSLYEEMNDVDKEKFYCCGKDINVKDYLRNYILGTRHFLLKETPESLPKARAALKRMYYLDCLVTCLFYGLIVYLLWRYFDVVTKYFS